MVRGEVVLEKIAESITNDPDATILDAQVRTKCLRRTNYRYELWSWDHNFSMLLMYRKCSVSTCPLSITMSRLVGSSFAIFPGILLTLMILKTYFQSYGPGTIIIVPGP